MEYHLRNADHPVTAVPISQAVGGEGYIVQVSGQPDRSLKIFHDPSPDDLESRLLYMISHPPATITDRLAWPEDIVEDSRGGVAGYPQRHFGPEYVLFSTIASSLTRPDWVSDLVLRQCAYDAAYLLAELHAHDYLYPDIHDGQFLVAKGRPAVLIDTASCQFKDGDKLYPCLRVRDEYQGPELRGVANWADVAEQRDVYTDSYSLAVLIFGLTLECHPFDAVQVGTGKALSPSERAKKGCFPFDKGCRDYRPPPNARPYRHVHPDVQDLFFRAFVEGAQPDQRTRRPTAAEWADVLRHCPVLYDQPAQTVAAKSPAPSDSIDWSILVAPVVTCLCLMFRPLGPVMRHAWSATVFVLLLLTTSGVSYYLGSRSSWDDGWPVRSSVRDPPPPPPIPRRRYDPSAADVQETLARIRSEISRKRKNPFSKEP